MSRVLPRPANVAVLDDGGEIDSIGLDPIQSDHTLAKLIEDAKFGEEILIVYVYPSTNENDPPHITVSVNGITQPICRGVPTPVRRKYVEVLARMKETRYSQPAHNSNDPERSNVVVPRTGMVYPFEVQSDPNRHGRAWLQRILAEPA